MRVVVFGAGGLLASAVVREFRHAPRPLTGADAFRHTPKSARGDAASAADEKPGGVEVIALEHHDLDVTDRARVDRLMAEARPDVLINCAAYNHVDAAEDDALQALEVNAFAVLTLGTAARDAGATFVHYSTDFVFDGETSRPYRENDTPNPRSVYGASKLLGDWFALDDPSAYVLRVESLFGEPAPGHARRGSLGTILDRLKAGQKVSVFIDRTVSPSYTADVATATRALLESRAAPGLYHCVNSGAASWAEIAEEIARLLGVTPEVEPLTLETAGLRAPRPRYCALSNAKLHAAGIAMPSWQDALRRFLTEH